ncbi:MAG: ABC transporter substrate-binding protein [Clostridia bacterium]|nr:ABC transporter substrate-binding protein [Clostridia bacterium]
MKKFLFVIIFILLIALSSCGDKLQEESYYSFTDSNGYTVNLSEKPQKVAVLFSSYVEMWTLAGGETYVTVGESIERGFVNKDTLLVDTGAGKSINYELLISYKPDFVICSSDIAVQIEVASFLRNNNIPCASFKVENFDDYLWVLNILTDITGQKENYRVYGADIKSNIDTLLNKTVNNEQKKILFIRASSSAKSTKAKTADEHFVALMLKELGTYNIAENVPVLLDGLSAEEIIKENPNYIFISTMGDFEKAQNYIYSLFETDTYKNLDAVKNGNYCFLEKDLYQFKPNHRWYEAYLNLWEILYEE